MLKFMAKEIVTEGEILVRVKPTRIFSQKKILRHRSSQAT